MCVDAEIAHYVKTGEHDLTFAAWSGNLLERAIRGDADLKVALIAEVGRRTVGLVSGAVIPDADPVVFVRRKVEPMIRGTSAQGRILVVSHTETGDRIRLISARDTSRRERRFYEEGE